VSASADLVIDLGHSRAKWGRCVNGDLIAASVGACSLDDPRPLTTSIERNAVERVIWSTQSHGDAIERLRNDFRVLGVSCRTVSTGSLDLPVAAAYSDLGSDRWLALQWPWSSSRRALCVIDAGTAVTVDAVDASGRHLGGWIMAGMNTLRAGLAQRAPRLPAPDAGPGADRAPAASSAAAIAGGLELQLIGGVRRALDRLEDLLGEDFDCWLTGGDADRLGAQLGRAVQHDPHLVLRGLALAGARS
jgi:type III pantothenate kinase